MAPHEKLLVGGLAGEKAIGKGGKSKMTRACSIQSILEQQLLKVHSSSLGGLE
jgi:hypothetical protein